MKSKVVHIVSVCCETPILPDGRCSSCKEPAKPLEIVQDVDEFYHTKQETHVVQSKRIIHVHEFGIQSDLQEYLYVSYSKISLSHENVDTGKLIIDTIVDLNEFVEWALKNHYWSKATQREVAADDHDDTYQTPEGDINEINDQLKADFIMHIPKRSIEHYLLEKTKDNEPDTA